MSLPLLATKLYFPPARSRMVLRPRLAQRIAEGLEGPLTLLSAPAGYGKTTLLSEWRSGPGKQVAAAWFALDEGDNDIIRFLSYLTAALENAWPGLTGSTSFLLQAPTPPPLEAVLTSLINDLSREDRPVVIVLDDFHTVSAQNVQEAVAFLLEHLPPNTHLVILTRSDPRLPLARLRAKGQLTEIRAAQLRFTAGEAAQFFNQTMGLNLSAREIGSLEQRTEGWIAGLQLAALALQGQEDPAGFSTTFTDSHRYIVDYLADEVLRRQPQQVQTFLLQTSILERFCGPLCDVVVLASGPSQAVLEQLDDSNLFLVPLDGERSWYRYHHLFGEVLRTRLRQTYPELVPDLHRRAAAWYEQNGLLAEAVHHALETGDTGQAARLVEQNAMNMLMRGELITLQEWIRAVRDAQPGRPWLAIYHCWSLMLMGQLEQAVPILEEAERRAGQHPPGSEAGEMQGHLSALKAYRFAYQSQAAEAVHFAQKAYQLLPESSQSIRSVVAFLLGGTRLLSGDTAGASQAFLEAAGLGKLAGNLHVAIPALSSYADQLGGQGRLHQAAEAYQEAVQMATLPGGRVLPVAARAWSGLGRIYYEWNNLEAVGECIQQCLELCQQWGNIDSLVSVHLLKARLQRAQGDLPAAWESLEEAERISRTGQLIPGSASYIDTLRLRLWLLLGNLEAAVRWAQENGLKVTGEISPMRAAIYPMFGRVLVAQGKVDEALELVGRLLRPALADSKTGQVIGLLVLQALAFQARNDQAEALNALEQALSLAQPEDYVRTFIDEGAPMEKLLRLARSRGMLPEYTARLLVPFVQAKGAIEHPAQQLIDPISERELEVLRLIAAGRTNKEIAAALVISVPTVKRHSTNLFRKLDVGNRTEAVARARKLELL